MRKNRLVAHVPGCVCCGAARGKFGGVRAGDAAVRGRHVRSRQPTRARGGPERRALRRRSRPGRNAAVSSARGVPTFAGATGAVSRLWKGEQTRIATGLPSSTRRRTVGCRRTGPARHRHVRSREHARLPRSRERPGASSHGAPGLVSSSAGWPGCDRTGSGGCGADVAAHETSENPDGGPFDRIRTGCSPGDSQQVVADAGANALLRVGANGRVSTLATFPSRPQGRSSDSVPTAVAAGPDGALYVSELTGAPFLPGAANVYRVDDGQAPTVFAAGFSTIADGSRSALDGSLYVLEFGQPFPIRAGQALAHHAGRRAERSSRAGSSPRDRSSSIGRIDRRPRRDDLRLPLQHLLHDRWGAASLHGRRPGRAAPRLSGPPRRDAARGGRQGRPSVVSHWRLGGLFAERGCVVDPVGARDERGHDRSRSSRA